MSLFSVCLEPDVVMLNVIIFNVCIAVVGMLSVTILIVIMANVTEPSILLLLEVKRDRCRINNYYNKKKVSML